jgi:F-type H+-transporting ATPase subunit gamma
VASAKEIRGQIKAIQNTGKITKAMEMVAASKMRKAQERVLMARAYAEGIERVVHNLMQAHPEYQHPFLVEKDEVKRIGLVVITTDKGLCGGLNANTMKAALKVVKSFEGSSEAYTVGRRGGQFMRRVTDLQGAVDNIPDTPDLADIIGVVKVAMQRFLNGEVDEVRLVFSEFVNTMVQTPRVNRLLPCPKPEEQEHPGYWDYLYEPDSKEVLEGLLERYVEAMVYHAVLENKACEQSARMVAMKAATDNAKSIVKDLRVTYNKARQAAITQEIAEISAGAQASA